MRKRWLLAAAVIVAAIVAWMAIGRGDGSGGKAGVAKASPDEAGSAIALAGARVDRHGGDPSSLAGTVKTKAGAAIVGAWVCAQAWDEDLVEDQREPRCTTTGADGGWKLEPLFAGKWNVNGGADGKIPSGWRGPDRKSTIALHAGEARTGIDLVLGDGGVQVSGTVLDLTGGAVADARVSVSGRGQGRCMTRSGADGTFHCWVAPGPGWASATADGYTSGWSEVDAPEEGIELLLTPESTLDGVVVMADTKEPVAGAQIEVDGDWGYTEGMARSDDQGRFHVAHLAPGRYKPTADAPGLHGEVAESVLVGLAQGKDGLVIEMHASATVHGTVTADGKPADDCSVTLRTLANDDYHEETDDDGVVTFDAVEPGTYSVKIECMKESGHESYDKLVVADAPVEAAWQVDVGGSLTGLVVDSTGAPVAHASVSVHGAGKSPWGGQSDDTDDAGHFEVVGLQPGPAKVEVYAEGHPAPEKPLDVEIGKDHDLRVVLPAGGSITGKVMTAAGKPVPRVQVMAQSGDRMDWRSGNGRTRGDGSFEMHGMRPGDYRVIAQRSWGDQLRKPGTTDDDTQGAKVTVVADQTATVELTVEDPSGSIRGKVVDQTGAPVTDAFLRAERESDAAGAEQGGAMRQARWSWDKKPSVTSTDGSFAIDDLSPGTYTVLAYRKGGSEAKSEHVAIGATVTMTIARSGSLSGTVSGAAPRRLTISIGDKQSGYQRTESFFLGGGKWVLHDLPAGTYDIGAVTPDGKGKLEAVTLAEGEDKAGLEVPVTATVTLTGHVVDATTHAPIKDMQVFVTPLGGQLALMPGDFGDPGHTTDETGGFKLEGIATGRSNVVVFPQFGENDTYDGTMRPFDIEGSGTVDVGQVAMRATRLPPHTEAGDLGYTLVEAPPMSDPATWKLQVASVKKGGPAAAAGLQVGDVIVSVDGTDVTGDKAVDYYTLTQVPVGTTVSFGLARGSTVAIKAVKAE